MVEKQEYGDLWVCICKSLYPNARSQPSGRGLFWRSLACHRPQNPSRNPWFGCVPDPIVKRLFTHMDYYWLWVSLYFAAWLLYGKSCIHYNITLKAEDHGLKYQHISQCNPQSHRLELDVPYIYHILRLISIDILILIPPFLEWFLPLPRMAWEFWMLLPLPPPSAGRCFIKWKKSTQIIKWSHCWWFWWT